MHEWKTSFDAWKSSVDAISPGMQFYKSMLSNVTTLHANALDYINDSKRVMQEQIEKIEQAKSAEAQGFLSLM